MTEDGILRVNLSPDSHPSLAFSCADKLLWHCADQILTQDELVIAYPCLNCRGGLSLFLAYLPLAIEENSPGKTPAPILVYPGTAEILESYIQLRVQVGDLLNALKQRRVRAGRGCFIHRWEEIIFHKLQKGTIDKTEEFPLHDFFPAAVLREDGSPHIFAGRDGFGRGDETAPPLQFATRIMSIPPSVNYRAAIIVYDAMESRSELVRLQNNLGRVHARTRIHLFESPFSPILRKLLSSGRRLWRLEAEDFSTQKWPLPCDEELRRALDAERRTHSIPSPIAAQEQKTLWDNLTRLRNVSGRIPVLDGVCTLLNSLYWLITTLPVPVEHYDSVVGQYGWPTLLERIDEIKDTAEVLGPGVEYSLVDESFQILGLGLERLKAEPSRARGLVAEVKRGLREGRRLGIVVSRSIYAAAIEQFLAAELQCEPLSLPEKNIHVIDVRSLSQSPAFDILLFFAYRGERALRWFMSGRAKEFIILLTEQEKRTMSRHIRAAPQEQNSWKPVVTSPSSRQESAGSSIVDSNGEMQRETLVTHFELGLGEEKPTLPLLPFEDESLLRELEDYRSTVEFHPGQAGLSIHRMCRKIVFRAKYTFLPVEGSATVLGKGGASEKRVGDLRVGDVILFVNGDQRNSIYELMLNEIRKSPVYTSDVDIIGAWHRRLQAEFATSGMTGTGLHRKLHEAGSTVVVPTVAGWLRGSVMSPLEAKNLERLFSVLKIANPESKYSQRVDKAARRLRNVYRQYAKAVNAFLLRTAGDARPELDALLDKYNLDIEAIREAVIAEEIEEIVTETSEVPSSLVGELNAI